MDSRSRRGSGARVPKTQWGESPEHVCLHESFVQKPANARGLLRGGVTVLTPSPIGFVSTCPRPRGYIPGEGVPGACTKLPGGVLFGQSIASTTHASIVMVASQGHLGPRHDPRHDLLLIGVACASTLLSYAVGITVTASLYHSTHHRSAIPQRTQRNSSSELTTRRSPTRSASTSRASAPSSAPS